MGAIQTGSGKVLTEGKPTARVGDGVLVTAAEMAAALGGKAKPPTAPKGQGTGAPPLAPSAGGAGGSYEPTMDYEGNLQEGVPGSAIIDLDRGANSTYGTLQDYINLFTSPGLITGGTFSANGTYLNVDEGSVLLRIEDDDLSAVRFFNFPSGGFAIPDDGDTHYIGIDYNDGDVQLAITTDFDSFDKDTEIPLGSAVNINGSVFFLNNPYKTSDAMTNVIQRFDADAPVIRDNSIEGLIISEGPSRTILLTPGKIWARLTDYEIPQKDSAVDGMLTVFWNGVDLQFGATTTWDNTKYNDVDTGTLVTLDDNRYACLWFYCAAESGTFGYAYGRHQHTSIADAQFEQPPTYLTPGFKNQTLFIGRLIFKKGASTASSLDSAFILNLPSFAAQDDAKVASFYDATGVITGGNLTVNVSNNQTFDVSGGVAVFMDFSVPGSPTQEVLEFGPFTAQAVPDIGTRLTTYIGINSTGAVVQQASPFTATQRRTIASLGLVVHSNLVNINTTNIIATTVHAGVNQMHDMMDAIGALNVFGNQYTANGANLLLDKSAGRIFKLGINFQANVSDPHNIEIAAQTGLTFRYRTQDGTESANTTTIDPNNYDVGGVVTDISPALRFTIQRINIFQSGLTRIQYGQNLYGSMAEAEAALASEAFNVEQNIAENGIHRAYLIVQDTCTDLSDPTKAKFVSVTKFGALAAGGVSISNTDALPQGTVNLYFANTLARVAMESDVVRITGNGSNNLVISHNTADGADIGRINITAGGTIGSGRSAYIQLNGNENAISPGKLILASGDNGDIEIVSNGAIKVNTNVGIYMDAVTGDKISLFDNRLGAINMYGLGLESNNLYTKSPQGLRMYFGVNADLGTSDSLRFSNGGIEFMLADQKITADFSGAVGTRTMFQTSTVNGPTNISAVPNGSSKIAIWSVFNSNTVNASTGQLRADDGFISINSSQIGTGNTFPLRFQMDSITRAEITPGGMFRVVATDDIFTQIPSGLRGIEMFYRTDGANDQGQINCYDRTALAYKPMSISALSITLGASSTPIATANTLGLTITNGHLRSTAMHNNSTLPSGASVQYVASGTYTPTLTNVTNIETSTAYACQWMRVGNVVTVSGKVDINTTTASVLSEIGISLPIDSAITLEQQAAGTAAAQAVAGLSGRIMGDAANDRAKLLWTTADISNRAYSFTFTYVIL